MVEPIVFISHFRVKEGKLDDLERLTGVVARNLEAEKPRTLVFLSYLNDDGTRVSFVHLFANAESMDAHVEGSDERSRAALEFMEPEGWEFYGTISDSALQTMRQAAASSGATLTVEPDYLAGFLRL
jgi:hypothetical protein